MSSLPHLQRLKSLGKIDPDDFLIFNQQLLTLNRSGLPLAKSLDLLTHQPWSRSLRELLAETRRRVQAGALVSEAFEALGAVPPMFIAALRAGERSGNLDETLAQYLILSKRFRGPCGKRSGPPSFIPAFFCSSSLDWSVS